MARGKVIAIHHRMNDISGHHFTEAIGSREEYRRRGREVVFLVSRGARPRLLAALGEASAVLEDPTFRLEWSFAERTERFVALLHAQIDPIAAPDDRVFLTIATQLEANALAQWLRELPAEKQPWIVTVFLSDRWNRSGPAEQQRQLAEWAIVRGEMTRLSAQENRKLLFFSVTEGLAAEISRLSSRAVQCAPTPLRYQEPAPDLAAPNESGPPIVALLGGLRAEKGSDLVPQIFQACRAMVDVRFRIQMVNEALSPEDFAAVLTLAKEPTVTAITEPMGLAEYAAAMQTAHLGLFPYQVTPYLQRTSAVFSEAVAYGKPTVVTPGTWLSEQVEAGRAVGIISTNRSPESYARGIAECVARLPALTKSAQAVAAKWRNEVSMTRFVHVVEGEIARREMAS